MNSMLIVDDNPGDIELMRTAMCEVDATVQIYAVSTGVQALAFLTKESVFSAMPMPDLVLLDLNMPGISGFQALRVIRDTPAWSKVLMFIWSSSERGTDRSGALDLGATEFVVKPATWDGMVTLAKLIRARLPARESCNG